MEPNEKYEVTCSINGDVLLVTVAGSKMRPLTLGGLKDLEGPVTLRAQGVRLALDNVEMRQTE